MSSPNAKLAASNLYNLNGFKAVVTGGGTGIGLMITQTLVANGATVYITGRREEVLKTTADKYGEGGKIIPITCDLTSRDDILRLAKEVGGKESNGIHVLVNNAGVAKEKSTTAYSSNGEPDYKSAESISEHLLKSTHESWAETFETNVTAGFFVSAAFLPLLAKGTANNKGYSASIVNVASISGMMRGSSSGQFAYAASKAAALHTSKMLGTTLAQAKGARIRVNTIAPGIFPSEMTQGESGSDNKSNIDGSGDSLPAGRPGKDDDMASAILYLVGPSSTFTNGQVLYPDGGAVLTQPAGM